MSSSAAQELAALRYLQRGVEPLDTFIRRVSPRMPPPKHIRRIMRLFERSRREEVRALVTMPPRHAKTTTFKHGVAWRVKWDPACLNFYASYASGLSEQFSRDVRRMIRREAIPLSKEINSVEEWQTTLGGGLKSTSVGGSITGRGCNGGIIVVDDAIKGREQAESKLHRDKVWDWFRADVMSRLEPGASLIACNTRWHEDDLIGRLLKDGLGEKWVHINLAAVTDGHGRAIDERLEDGAVALWPEEYPLARLAKIRLRGEYDWWSLYQQMPRKKGDKIFGDEPARFDLQAFTWDGQRGVIVLDPSGTAKTSSDFAALGAFAMRGYSSDSRMRVVDVRNKQITVPQQTRDALAMQRKYGLLVAVEAVGGFKAIPDMMREAAPRIRLLEITPLGDKFTRAQPASGAWNDGRIEVPIEAEWDVDGYVEEMQAFTGLNDPHDNQVDITAHAWNTLYRESPVGDRRRQEEAPEF